MGRYYIGSQLNQTYYISHHGIKGQKWGIRRFQNPDGSLTDAGQKRYNATAIGKELNKNDTRIARDKTNLAISRMKRDKAYNRENDKKVAKYDKKIKEYEDRVKDGESRAKTLISIATKKGYSVNSKDVIRYGNDGKMLAEAFFGSPIARAATDVYRTYKYGDRYGSEIGGAVAGRKYKVVRN